MKYIRTKDGIFRRYKNSTIIDNIFYYPDDGIVPEYRREPILKQADTIEELCDEFVLINTEYENSKDIFESHGGEAKHRGDSYYNFSFEQIRTGRRIIKGTIYGAIWTDKGLKYVAKMNEKGELELLYD